VIAYFEVHRHAGEEKRIMRVDHVRSEAHARALLARISECHAAEALLISLEFFPLHFTAHEIESEKNLLGREPRRASSEPQR
jgi:hypothetical protein